MKQGFWDTIYAFIESMQQAGTWMLYGVMGILLAGLAWWVVWWWGQFKRSAGIP